MMSDLDFSASNRSCFAISESYLIFCLYLSFSMAISLPSWSRLKKSSISLDYCLGFLRTIERLCSSSNSFTSGMLERKCFVYCFENGLILVCLESYVSSSLVSLSFEQKEWICRRKSILGRLEAKRQ